MNPNRLLIALSRACSRPVNLLTSLGLIVTGDFALATGADRHVAFAASLLAANGRALSWAWFVPADRVQIAAALQEAWLRPHAVACFGGLGTGVDDQVVATVAALQGGREATGLPRHPERAEDGVTECGNIAFFPGAPERAHPAFERWLRSAGQSVLDEAATYATEKVRWQLPESSLAADARRAAREAYPMVMQRLIGAANGEVMLSFEGPSRGKTQDARKLLQRELGRR